MEFMDKMMLLKGSEMSAGLHFRNLILNINCCRTTALILD